MADAGAKVIADDTSYPLEPFFQDGVVSQAIDAVKARGVAYFASAGNEGRASWEGTFKPTNGGAAGPGNFHDFGSGAVDQNQKIATAPPGRLAHGLPAAGRALRRRRSPTSTRTSSTRSITPSSGATRPTTSRLDMPIATMPFNEQRRAGETDRLRRQAIRRHAHAVHQVHDRQQLRRRPADRATTPGTRARSLHSAGAKGALAVAAVAANDPGTNDPEDLQLTRAAAAAVRRQRRRGSATPEVRTSRRSRRRSRLDHGAGLRDVPRHERRGAARGRDRRVDEVGRPVADRRPDLQRG